MTFLEALGMGFIGFCFYAAATGGGGSPQRRRSAVSKLIKKMVDKRSIF